MVNNEAQASQLVKMTFYLGISKAAVRQSTPDAYLAALRFCNKIKAVVCTKMSGDVMGGFTCVIWSLLWSAMVPHQLLSSPASLYDLTKN